MINLSCVQKKRENPLLLAASLQKSSFDSQDHSLFGPWHCIWDLQNGLPKKARPQPFIIRRPHPLFQAGHQCATRFLSGSIGLVGENQFIAVALNGSARDA